jgi:hypothetical protein
MLYKSFYSMSLYLENIKKDTYCIIVKYENTKEWKIYGFIRFSSDDSFSTTRILFGLRYGLILRKLSYGDMHDIVKRVTDKVLRYREDVKFCVAVLEN